MQITCWGARGSIPISGKEYLNYGGDTTCIELRTKDNDVIIIDAGTGMRRLGNKLLASNERDIHLLFTHAHWDHLLGFPFFKPIYMKGTRISMYGCPYAQSSVKDVLSRSMTAPYFPVEFGQLQAEITSQGVCEQDFAIGSIHISPIQLNHPNQGMGYRFTEDGKSFVFLTDNELTHRHAGGEAYEEYVRFSAGADLLIHDAEYTEKQYALTRGWGHSVYTDALQLAMDAQVGQFGLFHHNQERTDDELDRMVADCGAVIKNSDRTITCFAAQAGMVINL